MTSRERVRLALAHQETDRVPIALVCSGINAPADGAFDAFLKARRGLSLAQYLEPLIDIQAVGPDYIGPALAKRTDIWGVRRKAISYGASAYDEIDYYPLRGIDDINLIKSYHWPQAAWFDYAGLPDKIRALRAKGDPCLMALNGNIFESSWYMRGFEQIFLDLALNPEMAHAILDRVAEFWLVHFRNILAVAKGEIDLVFTADDIAGQNGLLMSLEMWETHLKPYHARLNHLIHEFGAKVIYHSDGAVQDAVPGLIDMGIDILQALQFDARGMDAEKLKSAYGQRLCFEGGVSVQHTLPFGTPDDVRREVRELKRVLGRQGGYILGPAHAIQAGTPPDNIYAMFETARE